MTERAESETPKQVRLTQSVFTYVADCLKDRDEQAIRRLRLRPDQMDRLSKMTATDFLRLGELGKECITLDINPEALDEVFRCVEAQRRRMELVERCLRRDAPRAMMKMFFGLARHRYTALRTALSINAAPGRPARQPETIEVRLYDAWRVHRLAWTAETLLDIAETLDVPLRVVWDQLRRFRTQASSNGSGTDSCVGLSAQRCSRVARASTGPTS
jgi:Protein of unknown function (DUF2857)